jgi:hypothetical protein
MYYSLRHLPYIAYHSYLQPPLVYLSY